MHEKYPLQVIDMLMNILMDFLSQGMQISRTTLLSLINSIFKKVGRELKMCGKELLRKTSVSKPVSLIEKGNSCVSFHVKIQVNVILTIDKNGCICSVIKHIHHLNNTFKPILSYNSKNKIPQLCQFGSKMTSTMDNNYIEIHVSNDDC